MKIVNLSEHYILKFSIIPLRRVYIEPRKHYITSVLQLLVNTPNLFSRGSNCVIYYKRSY